MDPAGMRQAFIRLGCSQQAAQAVVDDQGIDSINELKILTDEEVENLCKAARRPGGQAASPSAGQEGQQAEVPNRGTAIPLRAENNVKLASYMLKHRIDRVSRPTDMAFITLANARAVRELKEHEKNYKPPEEVPKIDEKDWPKTFEAIDERLSRLTGECDAPLASAARRAVEVPAAETDPETNYATATEEMI